MLFKNYKKKIFQKNIYKDNKKKKLFTSAITITATHLCVG
jgi:hypothetical protein